uniref:Uncharacterized protein n=1 Tax=Arundo donax TaxID=35708 RepID=A0A0A9BQ35_ARUDO
MMRLTRIFSAVYMTSDNLVKYTSWQPF